MPTLVNIDTFPQIAEPARGEVPRLHRHMVDLHERRYATIAAARDAGIPVYVGTDAGGSLPHGLVATEVAHLAHAGFTTTEALDAACWGARAWLGRPGLEEGEEADLVVYADDPREDLAALAAPTLVVLRGRPSPDPRRARLGRGVPPLVRGPLTSRDIIACYSTDNVRLYQTPSHRIGMRRGRCARSPPGHTHRR